MEDIFQKVVFKIEELKSFGRCAYYFTSTVNGYSNTRHGVDENPGYAITTIANRLFKTVEKADPNSFSTPLQLYEFASIFGGDNYEYYLYYDNSWHQPLMIDELCLYYYFTKYTHI